MKLPVTFAPDTAEALKRGLLAGLALLAVTLPPAMPTATATSRVSSFPVLAFAPAAEPDFGSAPARDEVRLLARGILQSQDHRGLPFAIVDKQDARVFIFTHTGQLAGSSPVLLGYAPGDDSVPGIGERPIEAVRPSERTTPAGRFVTDRGRNALGDHVVWVDYAAGVSMHPVRLTDPSERRAERLASPTASDNRISYGCINVPPDFFRDVVWPHFSRPGHTTYVMPETRPLADVFPQLVAKAS